MLEPIHTAHYIMHTIREEHTKVYTPKKKLSAEIHVYWMLYMENIVSNAFIK